MFTRWFARVAVVAAALIAPCAAAQTAIDRDALQRLVQGARGAHSTCLVVWQDGKPVTEEWFDGQPRPIEAMSATKSVVNLAIGRLVTEGKIQSADQRVSEFFPEWKQGQKRDITLRHLLNHTSGMQNVPTTDKEIYPSPDFVRLALAAEITSTPGSEFAYNNKAVNLLAGVVEKASGQKLDEYLREGLFGSLGIEQFTWTHDKAGNPHGMSGLQILPADFAKLGQLVVQRGNWKGDQLIAASWFDESMKAGQPYVPTCGLLWWLISDREERVVDDEFLDRMRKAGVDGGYIEKIASMRGRYTPTDYRAKFEQVFGPDWQTEYMKRLGTSLRPRVELGSIVGYAARGYLGQYLLVFPEPKIVVVRMREASETTDERVDNFEQIDALSMALWRGAAKDVGTATPPK